MEGIKKFFQMILAIFGGGPAKIEPPKQEVPSDDGRELPAHDESQRVKLAIIVGHTRNASGAQMGKSLESEYVFNTRIANFMADLCKVKFPQIVPKIIYRDGIGIEGAYRVADQVEKCDLAIELHFNAANGRATGTETLCTSAPNDVEFAHMIQKQMCRVFGRSDDKAKGDRGVKAIARTARGGGNVHSFPGGANCLVEPFFGDNAEEEKMAYEKQREYAECLLDGVLLYAKKRDLLK